jgi:hypothetical protein
MLAAGAKNAGRIDPAAASMTEDARACIRPFARV